MELLDCRRLPGPNLLWNRSSVVLDIACSAEQSNMVQSRLQTQILDLHARLGWPAPEFSARERVGGLSLAFDGPIDRLYAGIALAEQAWKCCFGAQEDLDEPLESVVQRAAEEANPALLALQSKALETGAPLLWDDDEVSIGFGTTAQTWPSRPAPCPDDIDWAPPRRIPTALITGTNGKTTTARMCAAILRSAGYTVGLSSTEGIWINDLALDKGDYAGPGGARMILRHREASAAVLETARGGLLRRGLGVDEADAAVITNIAADHLGDFGSRTLAELLEVKWIVSRAVRQPGVLVLNADDPLLIEKARTHDGRISWFSLDPARHTAEFRPDGEWLIRDADGNRQRLCRIDDIPLTLNGAAQHNVANALAAAAVCSHLRIEPEAIAKGLTGMQQDDNPGRGNLYHFDGVSVFVDFAHNPHAMAAIANLTAALPARRRLVAFAQAGDRTDELLRESARSVWAMKPERVIISELPRYARGRSHNEVYSIMREELLRSSCPSDDILHAKTEMDALEQALQWAQPGDLLIMLVLGEADAVRARLARLAQ